MELKDPNELLGSLERGHLVQDFARALRDAAAALRDMDGGKAKVSLSIDLVVKAEMVEFRSVIDTKLPKQKRRSSILFVTDDGNLSTQHPDQPALALGMDETRRPMRRPATIDA
jgi:hypothetical protein